MIMSSLILKCFEILLWCYTYRKYVLLIVFLGLVWICMCAHVFNLHFWNWCFLVERIAICLTNIFGKMNDKPAVLSTCNYICNYVWHCWFGMVRCNIHESLPRWSENWSIWVSISLWFQILAVKTVGEMVAEIPEHITPETDRVEELPQSKVSVLTRSINKLSELLLHARYRFVFCAIPSSESTPPC